MRNRPDLPTPRYLGRLVILYFLVTFLVGLPVVLTILAIAYGAPGLLAVAASMLISFFAGMLTRAIAPHVLSKVGHLGPLLHYIHGTHRLGT
ncbi:MAG: hypothetical protein QOC72_1446 [Methylobacteriaceae bacterium]|jgi:hypothetical protein|nr:hypothetical protein [Methylobacteriaceae bacterium]